jgi:glutathione S-transferase
MPTYKLYYFDAKGRAEVTRIMFHMTGTPFEDHRLKGEEWAKFKPSTPFGQMPVLDVDGKMFAQSHAFERLVAKRLGLYGKDEFENAQVDMMVDAASDFLLPLMKTFGEPDDKKAAIISKFQTEQMPNLLQNLEKNVQDSGFCVGNTLTWADISIYQAFQFATVFKVECKLDAYPRLSAMAKHVESNPKIAKWLKERPETNM